MRIAAGDARPARVSAGAPLELHELEQLPPWRSRRRRHLIVDAAELLRRHALQGAGRRRDEERGEAGCGREQAALRPRVGVGVLLVVGVGVSCPGAGEGGGRLGGEGVEVSVERIDEAYSLTTTMIRHAKTR